MGYRAKSSGTPHPIWVYGTYMTQPPRRPSDGAICPAGHYIDKGGVPGVNLYEIDPGTLCKDVGVQDCRGRNVYEQDIILYETENIFCYFLIWDAASAVDLTTGEICGIKELWEAQQEQKADAAVIGNVLDFPDFPEGIRHSVQQGEELPYLPSLDTCMTALPFFTLTCPKCGHTTLSCTYQARHKGCGGWYTVGFASVVGRKRGKERAPA